MRKDISLSLLRIALGFIFFWAFLDKVFGLGFATAPAKSWLQGASPTEGFLSFGVKGVFAPFFHGLAGNPFVDWLFMFGLLGVGLALILGVGLKVAGYSGLLLMFLIYLSRFPPKNNPLIDEHIIYIFVLLLISESGKMGRLFSLAKWWEKTALVKRYPVLA